jgi:hypothetical protein
VLSLCFLTTLSHSISIHSHFFCPSRVPAKTNFPLVEYEREALQYWNVKSRCRGAEDVAKVEISYTLPLGRGITTDELQRGIVITGESLLCSLGLVMEQVV